MAHFWNGLPQRLLRPGEWPHVISWHKYCCATLLKYRHFNKLEQKKWKLLVSNDTGFCLTLICLAGETVTIVLILTPQKTSRVKIYRVIDD